MTTAPPGNQIVRRGLFARVRLEEWDKMIVRPHERVELRGGRRAGVHLPMAMGLVRVAERASEIGASALQIFSDNPTAWRRRAETPPEAAAFRLRIEELDIRPVAIHAAYLVNLAGPDDDLFGRSVEMIRHELAHAPEFGARFVNVHVGSHRGTGFAPQKVDIAEAKKVAWCGCKHSATAPFCDGSRKRLPG